MPSTWMNSSCPALVYNVRRALLGMQLGASKKLRTFIKKIRPLRRCWVDGTGRSRDVGSTGKVTFSSVSEFRRGGYHLIGGYPGPGAIAGTPQATLSESPREL